MEPFTKERALLIEVCEANGFSIEWGNPGPPQYQLAKITGPDFCLIAYPHKTKSTGNRHIRLRDQKSASKVAADAAIVLLDGAAGYNCTFQSKHMSSTQDRFRKATR